MGDSSPVKVAVSQRFYCLQSIIFCLLHTEVHKSWQIYLLPLLLLCLLHATKHSERAVILSQQIQLRCKGTTGTAPVITRIIL